MKNSEATIRHAFTRLFVVTALACGQCGCATSGTNDVVSHDAGLSRHGPYTLTSRNSLLNSHTPTNADGSINVVVEIPTGTVAKWEVTKPNGDLEWEFTNGKPRNVKYLGYPGNYGMVPRTILAKEDGGDGDPLDVIVLGPAVPRGRIVKAKLIGVLRMLDGGEQDDKLIAVLQGSALYAVNDMRELDARFKGVSTIVETWFANYKGPGKIRSLGYADSNEARRILKSAAQAFSKSE